MSRSTLVVTLLVALPAGAAPLSEAEVLSRHEQYLQSLTRLDVTLEAYLSPDNGTTWHHLRTVRWRKDGDRERVTKRYFGDFDKAKGRFVPRDDWTDVVMRPDVFKSIRGLDPENPPPTPLDPQDQFAGVNCSIGRGSSSFVAHNPASSLFLTADIEHTLPELARVSPQKRFLGLINIDGREVYGFSLVDPVHKDPYRTYVDPARNYAIVRTDVQFKLDGGKVDESINRCLEFHDLGDGILFPKLVHNTGKDSIFQVRVTKASANPKVRDSDFDFDFPEGAKVMDPRDAPKDPKMITIHIWGRGEPRLTFHGIKEYQQWEVEQLKNPRKLTRPTWFYVVSGVLLLITVSLGIVITVRRRRRA